MKPNVVKHRATEDTEISRARFLCDLRASVFRIHKNQFQELQADRKQPVNLIVADLPREEG